MTRSTRHRASTGSRRRPACLESATATLNSMVHPHDLPTELSSRSGGGAADSGWIRSSHRLLVMRGLSPTEATNVVAYVAGLHPTEGGWSVKEIEQLAALRSRAACGVIAP